MSASTEKKLRQAAREAGTDKKTLAMLEEEKKRAKSKLRWTLGTVGVCLLIALILFLNSGLLYKTAAYSVGDRSYSAAEMNYQYANQYYTLANQYGSYASMFGLDVGLAALGDNACAFSEGTWRDYFLSSAESTMLQMTALVDYAKANGLALDEAELAEIEDSFTGVDEAAKLQGYANADRLFAVNYGPGVNTEIIKAAYRDSSLAAKALTQVSDSFEYTPEQLQEEYASYAGEKDIFDYASYYVAAATVETTDAEGNTSSAPTEETLAEAKASAQAIETAYKAGKGTDYLARLSEAVAAEIPEAEATEQSAAGGSLGDYKEWMMSASREAGDVAVTEQSSGGGFYVTVFVSRSDNAYPTANVRHILIKAVASEDGSYSDEAKATAKARAEELLAQWQAGDMTEESFAALAEEFSEDGGSNTNGGLYGDIAKGQMVQEFEDFCFAGHKPGDTDIVYGESGSYAGYHVVYFVGQGENYCDSIARAALSNADLESFLTGLQANYQTAERFGIRFVG